MGTQERDGLSQIAAPTIGSSDATNLPTNHRIAVTSGGRTLVVHGRHADGLQLAWRDRFGTSWHTQSTGAVSDGRLLSGTGTGDWPASIALARDSAGVEHAWVVWGRKSSSYLKPIQMARLSNLDDPGGPTVGPTMTIAAAPMGAYRPDIAFEDVPGGGQRAAIVWGRRSATALWELHATWFTDLDSDIPALQDDAVLMSDSTYKRWGTLVPTAAGMRVAARGASSKLRLYSHNASAPLSSWTAGAAGVNVADDGGPTAVALDSGEVLAAVETSDESRRRRAALFGFRRAGAARAPADRLRPADARHRWGERVARDDPQERWLCRLAPAGGRPLAADGSGRDRRRGRRKPCVAQRRAAYRWPAEVRRPRAWERHLHLQVGGPRLPATAAALVLPRAHGRGRPIRRHGTESTPAGEG